MRPTTISFHEEDEAEDDEEGSTNQGDVISPEDEEAVRDEEGYHDEDKPEEGLGAPPTIRLEYVAKEPSSRYTHPF